MKNKLGEYLRYLRGKHSLREISERSNKKVSHSYIADLEKGYSRSGKEVKPSPETLKVLAEVYDADYNYLMELAGYIEMSSGKKMATTIDPDGAKAKAMNEDKKAYWELTEKDEKDIQKELEEILNGLTNESSLAFMKNGEAELDEKDAELLRASMEQTLRLSKELAKQKFTPKKYRDKK